MRPKDRRSKKTVAVAWLLISIGFLAGSAGFAMAAFGEDLEKPNPEFSTQGDRVVAKLVPRGKSTSTLIDFTAAGGRLAGVEAVDLDAAPHGAVDPKDFRSALFAVKIDGVSPGSTVEVSLSSRYFTGATELWVFNRRAEPPLTNGRARNLDLPERAQALVLAVKDGGPFDSDGAADGQILLIAGPRDSFWGYALGTLFIRFFGIFIVLGLLQAGMVLAGAIFQRLQRAPVRAKPSPGLDPDPEDAEGIPVVIEPEKAAAIGVALHLHLTEVRASAAMRLDRPDGASWALQGRSQIMRDRIQTHDRAGRK
jgi:hypothetical protein